MDHEMISGTGDRQYAGVVGLMTARAAQYDIGRIVTATIGAMNDMMKLQPTR